MLVPTNQSSYAGDHRLTETSDHQTDTSRFGNIRWPDWYKSHRLEVMHARTRSSYSCTRSCGRLTPHMQDVSKQSGLISKWGILNLGSELHQTLYRVSYIMYGSAG